MPIIVVYDEAGNNELGRGDCNSNLREPPLNITHFNGGVIAPRTTVTAADALDTDTKVGYDVTASTQYTITLG